jgi:hypothetical protein
LEKQGYAYSGILCYPENLMPIVEQKEICKWKIISKKPEIDNNKILLENM